MKKIFPMEDDAQREDNVEHMEEILHCDYYSTVKVNVDPVEKTP